KETDSFFTDIEALESCQLFNLYYSLDPCGSRLEPVLNPNLSIMQPANVPRYQRYPLGDGHQLYFDSSVDLTHLWGNKRMDHIANLSPNHRANDVLVVAGNELNVTAKFCYGPMDLTALSRENVSAFICPQRLAEYFLFHPKNGGS
ncbi:unnamed protein product, partial [Cylicostephanus goldi]